MKIDKLVNAIKNQKTVLAVGPMSKNCIDATIEVEQLRNVSHNLDIDQKVKENIKYKINYYLESFGWNG